MLRRVWRKRFAYGSGLPRRLLTQPRGGYGIIRPPGDRSARMEPILLVLTNAPDPETARKLADGLVEARLAACVNVLAECASVYRWKGVVETASEVPMLIKTRAALFPEVEAFILSHHPYEVPEVIALPLRGASSAYLEWLVEETKTEPSGAGTPS
jgi:periplasmic divalent cation tolerance protein